MKLVIREKGGLGHEVLDLVLQLQEAGLKSCDEILFLDDMAKTGHMGYRAMYAGEVYFLCFGEAA